MSSLGECTPLAGSHEAAAVMKMAYTVEQCVFLSEIPPSLSRKVLYISKALESRWYDDRYNAQSNVPSKNVKFGRTKEIILIGEMHFLG